MRAMSRWAGLLAGAILLLPGCRSKEARFEPPPPPEEYLLPPSDDPRFSRPPEYKKNALEEESVIPAAPTSNRPRPGSLRGPRTGGGMGMGGMPY